MANKSYTVATASQLRGSGSWNGVEEIPGVDVMDYANATAPTANPSRLRRRSAMRRSVRFFQETIPEIANRPVEPSLVVSGDSSPITRPGAQDDPAQMPQLLMPVRYSPPARGEASKSSKESGEDSSLAVPDETEAKAHQAHRLSRIMGNLALNTDTNHTRYSSDSSMLSNSSRRGRKDAIYFTPTDVTRSQIFLSSPFGSPTLPKDDESGDSIEEDEISTLRASISSEVPAGPLQLQSPSKLPEQPNKLTIKPEQLDQLVRALVKCRLVQRDVRKHWWDDEDIPDDESVSTVTSVSTPTLTSASTLYSHPNDIFLNNGLSLDVRQIMTDRGLEGNSQTKKLPAAPDTPFGGIALADATVHGSPIRYVSQNFRVANHILATGACSFITVPYGVDVECNLRIEPPSTLNTSIRILLQCINQVVDRKTGKKASLLLVEVDVTSHFHRAALAELSQISARLMGEISIANSPTIPTESPDIDWIALADDLQATALVSDTIDTTSKHIAFLTRENCSMPTLALLSELSRIKDAHQDFLILKPIQWHENGVPSNLRLPWVSRRLWGDWYENEKDGVGHSKAARDFQSGIVAEVAQRVADGGGRDREFVCRVDWEGEGVVVKGVALGEKPDLWVCFVQGMFEL